ncbi:MAG: phosphatase PAP2 family protein, partial [Steroidobacteraceae bacterium]|nr:phosphatase PAP2 family protein [Steroidobacteraceae bacterium]
FGGSKQFTPAFVVSRECDKNCSFSSGEGAGGFFALALALALSRRRAALAAAFAVGCVVSYWRVASGAHFLSDTLVSFFVMLIVADVLYYYVVQRDPDPAVGKRRADLEQQPAGNLN